jgi:exonuclease SbcC
MLLERLAMTNFKRFREAEIHFRDGITGIIGNNGTGKSSIVEAVLFALYGVKGTGVNSDYIVSSFADPHDFCEVRLDFSLGGSEYAVYRKFKKGSHDASLFFRPKGSDLPEKELAKSVNEVGARIQEIIGMGPADFRNTIYAAQKDLLSLIENQPHARREWFMKALGIEYLKTRSDEILKANVDGTDELLRMQRVRSETLAAETGTGRMEALQENRALIEGREADLTRTREATLAIREGLGDLKTTLQSLEFAEKRLSTEERAVQGLAVDRERLATLSEALDRYREVERSLAALREKEPRFREISAEIRALNDQLKQMGGRWHEVMDELDRIALAKKELAKLGTVPSELEERKARERCMLEARSLTNAFREFASSTARLKGEESEREVRIRELESVVARYQEVREDLAVLEREKVESVRCMAGLSSDLAAVRQKQASLAADHDRILQAGPQGTCPLCHQRLGSHVADLDQEFAIQKRQFESAENQISSRLEKARREDNLLESRLAALRLESDRVADARLLLTDLSARREKDRATLARIQHEQEETQRSLERLGTGLYDPVLHKGLREEIAHLEESARRVEHLKAGLSREPDLEQERDRLVAGIEHAHTSRKDQEQRLQDLAFDETLKMGLEAELTRLSPVRDEWIGIGDRLSREAEIIARRDLAVSEHERFSREAAGIRDRLAVSGWSGQKPAEIQEILSTIEDGLLQCAAEKATIIDRISRLTAVLSDLKAAEEKMERLQDDLELYRAARRMVADYIVYLMQVVRSRIETDVSRILSDITSGRYDRVLIDEDFGLLVRDIDNDYPVERFSGGEQDDIAVALRIALSRYLARLHHTPENTFLIFDEIFGSQDEERRNNLLFALRSVESHFPQILLISHIPEMQGEFSNTLLVELGSDQASRIQEVNQ